MAQVNLEIVLIKNLEERIGLRKIRRFPLVQLQLVIISIQAMIKDIFVQMQI